MRDRAGGAGAEGAEGAEGGGGLGGRVTSCRGVLRHVVSRHVTTCRGALPLVPSATRRRRPSGPRAPCPCVFAAATPGLAAGQPSTAFQRGWVPCEKPLGETIVS